MRFCWTLAALLALVLVLMAYLFLIRGTIAPSSDGRTAVLLSQEERDLVLKEMRAFLSATQQILAAATTGDDLKPAVQAARAVGTPAQKGIPFQLIAKLPLGFKMLGLDTHRRFDQLALDAEQFGDPQQTLQALGELLQNCVGCHAAYRIEVSSTP